MILDIVTCLILFFVGLNFKNWIGSFSKNEKKVLTLLFFYHIIIAIVFHFYVAEYGGDATKYWYAPKEMSFSEIILFIKSGSASGILFLLNYFPSHILDLSFFTGNMCYALLGYLGFIYIFNITKKIFSNFDNWEEVKLFRISIFPWIWFLPNFHFWSSGVGKDTILFFCIPLLIYAMQKIKKRWILLGVSLVLSLLIRPHITLFLLISYGIAYSVDGNLKGYQKLMLILIIILGFSSIFHYVLTFINLETLDIQSIEDYANKKAMGLFKNTTGSGIDISSYPFPFKLFTFLFRPLFYDSPSFLGVLSSLENVILLFFTGKVIMNKPLRGFLKSNYTVKAIAIYFIIGSCAFALILGNLGIMLRQKNMLIPYFIIFGYWAIIVNKSRKNYINR